MNQESRLNSSYSSSTMLFRLHLLRCALFSSVHLLLLPFSLPQDPTPAQKCAVLRSISLSSLIRSSAEAPTFLATSLFSGRGRCKNCHSRLPSRTPLTGFVSSLCRVRKERHERGFRPDGDQDKTCLRAFLLREKKLG